MDAPGLSSAVIAALIVGLLLAFACQLLLAGLGVALGLTLWGRSFTSGAETSGAEVRAVDNHAPEASAPDSTVEHPASDSAAAAEESSASGLSPGRVGLVVGLGLLLTINGVVFVACYLAVRFCDPDEVYAGAILGLMIWAAYALVMTWLSARTANSVVGLVVSSAVAGLRQVFEGARSLWQATLGRPEQPLDAAETSDVVRQEMAAALDNLDIPALIEDYVDTQLPATQPPPVDTLPSLFQQLLQETGPLLLPQDQGTDQKIRSTVAQWVTQQEGIPETAVPDLVDQLTAIWQHQIKRPNPNLRRLELRLSTANLEDLSPEQLRQWFTEVEQGAEQETEQGAEQETEQGADTNTDTDTDPGLMAQGLATVSRQLKRTLRQRLDLSDLDVQTVWSQISPLLSEWLAGDHDPPLALTSSTVQDDVEDYLSTVPPWRFAPEILEPEFRQVLVDPDADADLVKGQVAALTRDQWVDSLEQREDLSHPQVQSIAMTLEAVQQSVLATLSSDGEPLAQADVAALHQGLENYLRYTNLGQITPDTLEQKLAALTVDLTPAQLKQTHLPMDTLTDILHRRRGLDPDQADQWLRHLEQCWQQRSREKETLTTADIATATDLVRQAIATGTSSDDLLPTLDAELGSPQRARQALMQIDWPTVRSPLLQQPDSSPEGVDNSLQQLQSTLVTTLNPPRRWVVRQADVAQDLGSNLMDYLVHSPVDQLSPQAIGRNLTWLLRHSSLSQNPLEGFQAALMEEVNRLDWDALQQALIQRKDLAADQVSGILDQLKAVLGQGRDRTQALLALVLEQAQGAWHQASQIDLDRNQLKADLQALWQNPPAALAGLTNPLTLIDRSGHLADTLADLSQDLLDQVLAAQGQVSDTVQMQTQGFKTWVRSRLDAVEDDIQSRQQAVKRMALNRINDARGVVAAAAWWLVAIALTSATTATLAGVVAVTGLTGAIEWLNW